MKLRVLLEAHHGATYAQTLALARATEEAGFDGFFRSDHYLGVEPNNPRFVPTDSWTMLAGLARDTRRVRLGTLVTATTFRLPGVLAIAVATADEMSGGRVELGVGAAWYAQEHAWFGIPRPPIIVGGGGPRRTPTLAARFADEFNAGFGEGLAERFARFRRICEETGRDPDTVTLSAALPVFCGADEAEAARRSRTMEGHRLQQAAACGRPDTVVARIEDLAEAGAQ